MFTISSDKNLPKNSCMDIIEKTLQSEKFFQKKDLPVLEQIVGLLFSKKLKKKDSHHLLKRKDKRSKK